MKLVTFKSDDNEGIGSLELDAIIPFKEEPSLPIDMLSFLEAGDTAIKKAEDLCKNPKSKISFSEVKLLAPISRPPKIIAIGLNYADHLEEVRAAGREMETPVVPMIFNKQSLSATGPYEDIHDPKVSEMLDFEGELTFVIGKKCRHVPKEKAHEVIAGYTIANDLSVRDWQLRVPTFTIGKSFDTHCPFGPAIVTPDEISDPHNLDLITEVNGEQRQSSNTKNLIFNCFDLVEHLSTAFTLEPGDLVLTGTPGGVGVVAGKFLKKGDVIKISIAELGYIENKVIDEPDSTVVL
ncbi:MAG TPA: fumarylacetoacetate hydrolase family protein [Gammaproteobacteria bacterium]|jgi:2-keto-4-pentenoate hydratase/2-oxohepta-3-ene-1,7-dioic acid hydratase in catechol pathway|nr:fumarylacetoacetate hydrolase family protein [Gammaproteobacteria bacterium]